MRSLDSPILKIVLIVALTLSAAQAQTPEGFCGNPFAGSCCEANGTQACNNPACCVAICAIDPFCCDVEWDQICANEACDEPLCLCFCICGALAGDCCAPHGSPGCNDIPCCEAVCEADPFCCDTEWDQICADEAAALCGCRQPDLIVDDIWLTPDPPIVGEPFTIHTNLCNVGDADIIDDIALEYFIDGNFACSDTLSSGLDADSCDTELCSNNVVNSREPHELCVVIDPDNDFAESNEGNNERCETFGRDIQDPTLIRTATFVDPNTVEPGAQIAVLMAVHNPNPIAVDLFLGTSIFSPSGQELVDPTCDEVVIVYGNSDFQFERCFNVDRSAEAGDYDVCYAIRDPDDFDCVYDSFCRYDELTIVVDPCGPEAGNCFEANGAPGCELVACCHEVCDVDPFCCDTTWDSICANEAIELCIEDLELVDGAVSPYLIGPGSSISVTYVLHNPNDFPVTTGLGCSIFLAGVGEEVVDRIHDINVAIGPRQTQAFERSFDIDPIDGNPPDAIAGPYTVYYALWKVLGGSWIGQYDLLSGPGDLQIHNRPFGTTVITHGFQASLFPDPDAPDWARHLGAAIVERAGGFGTVLEYDPEDGCWSTVPGFPANLDPDEELVLVFNWAQESDAAQIGGLCVGDAVPCAGLAEAAADALYAALRDPCFDGDASILEGTSFLAQGLHFIGHSRGAAVNSEVIQRLGLASPEIVVDHVTTLDPHPVNGSFPCEELTNFDWLDPEPLTWTNIDWADNYWRSDCGSLRCEDFDGKEVLGACNRQLTMLDDEDFCPEHMEVHSWYYGTVDLLACDDAGDNGLCATVCAICVQILARVLEREDWYCQPPEPGCAAGIGEGYHFSQVVGAYPASSSDCSGPGMKFEGEKVAPADVENPLVGALPSTIYQGTFQFGTLANAGWRYHGGTSDLPVAIDRWTAEGGNVFLRLGENVIYDGVQFVDKTIQTHNRMWINPQWNGLAFKIRNPVVSDDSLLVTIVTVGAGQQTSYTEEFQLNAVMPHWTPMLITVPEILRGRSCKVTFSLYIEGGLNTQVDIDDISFVNPCQADLDDDGNIGVLDLLDLLGKWGQVGGPEDFLERPGAGLEELLVLLANWGSCS